MTAKIHDIYKIIEKWKRYFLYKLFHIQQPEKHSFIMTPECSRSTYR